MAPEEAEARAEIEAATPTDEPEAVEEPTEPTAEAEAPEQEGEKPEA